MTIRKQGNLLDEKYNRDPEGYVLQMSSSEIFDNFTTPEEAMKKGYDRADELTKMRLKSKPFRGYINL